MPGQRRGAAHHHGAAHPQQQRNLIGVQGHRRPFDLDVLWRQRGTVSGNAVKALVHCGIPGRTAPAKRVFQGLRRSEFTGRDLGPVVAVVDGDKARADEDPQSQDENGVPYVQLCGRHFPVVDKHAVGTVAVPDQPALPLPLQRGMGFGDKSVGIHHIVGRQAADGDLRVLLYEIVVKNRALAVRILGIQDAFLSDAHDRNQYAVRQRNGADPRARKLKIGGPDTAGIPLAIFRLNIERHSRRSKLIRPFRRLRDPLYPQRAVIGHQLGLHSGQVGIGTAACSGIKSGKPSAGCTALILVVHGRIPPASKILKATLSL